MKSDTKDRCLIGKQGQATCGGVKACQGRHTVTTNLNGQWVIGGTAADQAPLASNSALEKAVLLCGVVGGCCVQPGGHDVFFLGGVVGPHGMCVDAGGATLCVGHTTHCSTR
jgi:hypothetical protein